MTTLTAIAIALRFFHFASLLAVFGAALFRLSVMRDLPAADFDNWLWRLSITAAATTLLSGAALLVVVAVRFVGTLDSALSIDGLATVVTQTEFGQVWAWRLAILAALVVLLLLARIRRNAARPGVAILSGMALAMLSAVGHAATGGGGTAAVVRQAADAVHLFAAAAWFGGLVALFRLLATGPDALVLLRRVVPRFSIMALIAAAAVAGSGVFEAMALLPGASALIGTGYGRLLLAKAILVAGMIALGAFDRLVLVRALDGTDAALGLAGLRHSVAAEIGLGAAVIAVVAVLGLLAPSI